MMEAGESQDRAAANPIPRRYVDLAEVRIGALEPPAMIDGHCEHAGDRPGERHHSRPGGPHCRAEGYVVVDPPVPTVVPDGRKATADRAVDWRCQTIARRRPKEPKG